MSVKIVIESPVRLSYPSLFQPKTMEDGKDPRYQATLIIPKTDTVTLGKISQALQSVYAEASQATGAWRGKPPTQPTISYYDGDLPNPRSGEDWGAECKGCMVLRTSSANKPDVVDEYGNKVMDATKVYAGCYIYAGIAFAGYDTNGNKGIGAFINTVMFAGDGEPFGAHNDAKADFAGLIAAKQNVAPSAYQMGGFVPGSLDKVISQQQTQQFSPMAQQAYVQPAPQPQTFGGFAPQTQPGAAPPIFGMGTQQ